jgi:hypothetical protein
MASNNVTDDKSKLLSNLYAESESAKAILNDFAERFRKRHVTTLDQVLNRVAGVSRSEAIRVFRSLQGIGCGEFIEGRKGHPSRFAWTDDLTAVGRAARGEVPSVSPLEEEEEEDDNGKKNVFEREHPLELRDDYIARVRVPADLTEREAERLATFIRSLPK